MDRQHGSSELHPQQNTRFKTDVANRLAYIHGGTVVSEWAYVPSAVNTADIGSRGCSPTGLIPWLSGPDFLSEDTSSWPVKPSTQAIIPAEEVKSLPVAVTAIGADPEKSAESGQVRSGPERPFSVLIHHFSSFDRLKRAVAWYRQFVRVLRDGSFRRWCLARRRGLRTREPLPRTDLTVSELRDAERAILLHVQRGMRDFSGVHGDDGPVEVRASSPLSGLRPCLENGLLVMGGRLGPRFLQIRLRHESRDKYVIHISKTAFQKNDILKRRITM